MHSIIEIDISRTCVISLDKAASTRPCKRMRSLVVDCSVRFHLHNEPRAIAPNQFRADQLARTSERITSEKRRAHNLAHYGDAPYLMHWCSLSISIILSIGSASTEEAIYNSMFRAATSHRWSVVRHVAWAPSQKCESVTVVRSRMRSHNRRCRSRQHFQCGPCPAIPSLRDA